MRGRQTFREALGGIFLRTANPVELEQQLVETIMRQLGGGYRVHAALLRRFEREYTEHAADLEPHPDVPAFSPAHAARMRKVADLLGEAAHELEGELEEYAR
jgi:hypothetical protein